MSKFTLLLHCDGVDNAPTVCAVDGEDGPDDVCVALTSLVQDWIDDNTLDNELHPYLDDTLNMLVAFNYVSRLIVLHIEKDDPHADAMLTALGAMNDILRPVMQRLAEDE